MSPDELAADLRWLADQWRSASPERKRRLERAYKRGCRLGEEGLNVTQVRAIRSAFGTPTQIAERFGVSQVAVLDIKDATYAR